MPQEKMAKNREAGEIPGCGENLKTNLSIELEESSFQKISKLIEKWNYGILLDWRKAQLKNKTRRKLGESLGGNSVETGNRVKVWSMRRGNWGSLP